MCRVVQFSQRKGDTMTTKQKAQVPKWWTADWNTLTYTIADALTVYEYDDDDDVDDYTSIPLDDRRWFVEYAEKKHDDKVLQAVFYLGALHGWLWGDNAGGYYTMTDEQNDAYYAGRTHGAMSWGQRPRDDDDDYEWGGDE